MDTLFKYSGLLIIFFTWVFMVLPFLIIRKKHKIKTVSEGFSHPPLGYVIRFGVFAASITQLMFVYYLSTLLGFSTTISAWLIFTIGSLCLLMASVFDTKSYRKLHNKFIKIYFLCVTLGGLLYGFFILKLSLVAGLLIGVDLIIMAIVGIYYYLRKDWTRAEIWIMVFSSLWAIIIYLYII